MFSLNFGLVLLKKKKKRHPPPNKTHRLLLLIWPQNPPQSIILFTCIQNAPPPHLMRKKPFLGLSMVGGQVAAAAPAVVPTLAWLWGQSWSCSPCNPAFALQHPWSPWHHHCSCSSSTSSSLSFGSDFNVALGSGLGPELPPPQLVLPGQKGVKWG